MLRFNRIKWSGVYRSASQPSGEEKKREGRGIIETGELRYTHTHRVLERKFLIYMDKRYFIDFFFFFSIDLFGSRLKWTCPPLHSIFFWVAFARDRPSFSVCVCVRHP